MSKDKDNIKVFNKYVSSLNRLLEKYPKAEDDIDSILEKEYKNQVAKQDKYINDTKIDFLKFLQKKHDVSSGITRDLQRYDVTETSNDNSKSEFNKFINDSKSLISEISATKNDMLQPFSLYVIGAGKSGKSTLINALVGENVATVGVLPKTWKVDRFFDADTKEAIIHYKDGTPTITISQMAAKNLVEEEEKKRKDSEKNILAKRREHYLLNPKLTLDEKEGITSNLNDLYLYRSNIRQVEWAIDVKNVSNSILKKFSMIDTPGVGQNHSGKDIVSYIGEDITAFSQADGMIWVLDATTLAAATPESLLRDLEESSEGITTSNKIAVLNRMDIIRKSAGDEGVKKTELAAQKMLGSYFTTILPFSAKEAFDGVTSSDKDKLHSSGYDELFKVINNVFSKESKNRITQKSERLNKNLMHKYDRDLTPYIERLNQDEQLLHKTYCQLKDLLQVLKIDLENAKENFLEEYKIDIETNIENYAANYLDITEDRERNFFLNEKIFKVDCMKINLNNLLISNQKYVSDFTAGQKKLNNKRFKRFKHLNEKIYYLNMESCNGNKESFSMSASDINFSGEDETSVLIGGGLAVAGMILLGPIGLLAGAADVFFGFSKGRKINSAKIKLTKHLIENIVTPTEEEIESIFRKLLEQAESEITESLSETFSQLHFQPTSENFENIRCLTKKLHKELTLPYRNNKKIPDAGVRLKPSLSLYLLRQKNANKY